MVGGIIFCLFDMNQLNLIHIDVQKGEFRHHLIYYFFFLQ